VNTTLGLGQNQVLDTAIKSGSIDMYPEFTGTALSVNSLPATQDPHQAYNEVKQYYEQNFHITWLDAAFNLNDSYGLCTNQQIAGQNNLKSMSDLVAAAPQLVLAGQQDFLDAKTGIFPPVAQAYGLTFKDTVQISEQLGFDAVNKGNAQINECYTTDPAIVVDNFVLLTDDKNAFPAYNPAPIVRDALLQKAPGITALLQPLESKLTTASQTALIKQVSVDKKSVKEVAQTWLQQEGLL
jgi:osmoprotectant transport system substrate-binding protein